MYERSDECERDATQLNFTVEDASRRVKLACRLLDRGSNAAPPSKLSGSEKIGAPLKFCLAIAQEESIEPHQPLLSK